MSFTERNAFLALGFWFVFSFKVIFLKHMELALPDSQLFSNRIVHFRKDANCDGPHNGRNLTNLAGQFLFHKGDPEKSSEWKLHHRDGMQVSTLAIPFKERKKKTCFLSSH